MKSEKELLEDLVQMSQQIGSNIAYVQGGGGNTSVKLDNQRMAIKASGYRLEQVTTQLGYTVVDYPGIQAHLQELGSNRDHKDRRPLPNFVIAQHNFRPSMESGFHALLDSCVLHTHPVYVNVLTCTAEGQDMLKQLFPQSLLLPYLTPGTELSLAVQQLVQEKSTGLGLIFLQNHGIIVSGEDTAICMQQHEAINAKICQVLSLPPFSLDYHNEERVEKDFLFPDQVIYMATRKSSPDSQAVRETIAAYSYLVQAGQQLGWKLNFLQDKEITALLNLDSEKYRQGLIQ